MKINVTCI